MEECVVLLRALAAGGGDADRLYVDGAAGGVVAALVVAPANARVAEGACSLLRLLARAPHLRRPLTHGDGVAYHLLRALQTHGGVVAQPGVADASCRALANLAEDTGSCAAPLYDAGAARAAVTAARTHAGHSRVVASAMAVLRGLAAAPTLRAPLVRDGVPAAALASLAGCATAADGSSGHEVVQAACAVLYYLAADGGWGLGRDDATHAAAVVAALRAHAAHAPAARAACFATQALAASQAGAQLLADVGCGAALADALTANPGSADIAAAAATAAGRIAAAGCHLPADALLRPLLAALRTHGTGADGGDIAAAGCVAVSYLLAAADDPRRSGGGGSAAAREVVEATEVALRLAAAHPAAPPVILGTCAVLAALPPADLATTPPPLASDAVGTLVAALRDHVAQPQVVKAGLQALAHFVAAAGPMRAACCDAAGVLPAVRLAAARHREVAAIQEPADAVLRALTPSALRLWLLLALMVAGGLAWAMRRDAAAGLVAHATGYGGEL